MNKQDIPIKQVSTFILKSAIVLIGLIVFAVCVLVLPRGIAAEDADGYRPILIGMLVSAMPFFVALYQSLKILSYIDKNQAFSMLSVRALAIIKYCALAIGVLYTAAMPYIYYAAQQDDAPGVVAMGLMVVCGSIVIATAAGLFGQLLQNVVDIKSENDLTV